MFSFLQLALVCCALLFPVSYVVYQVINERCSFFQKFIAFIAINFPLRIAFTSPITLCVLSLFFISHKVFFNCGSDFFSELLV